MSNIEVKEENHHTFRVIVYASNTTEHEVYVDPSYAQALGNGNISTADLIMKSFEFLLERESNNSILRSFDLSVINRYFPDYESEMKKLFSLAK